MKQYFVFKPVKLLLWLTLYTVCNGMNGIITSAYFKSHRFNSANVEFSGAVFKEMWCISELLCTMHCARDSQCMSYNYNMTGSKNKMCELMSDQAGECDGPSLDDCKYQLCSHCKSKYKVRYQH